MADRDIYVEKEYLGKGPFGDIYHYPREVDWIQGKLSEFLTGLGIPPEWLQKVGWKPSQRFDRMEFLKWRHKPDWVREYQQTTGDLGRVTHSDIVRAGGAGGAEIDVPAGERTMLDLLMGPEDRRRITEEIVQGPDESIVDKFNIFGPDYDAFIKKKLSSMLRSGGK